MDNAVVEPHVSLKVPIHPDIDLYTTGGNTGTMTHSFIYEVKLKGKRGLKAKIKGLFDNSALVNGICNTAFVVLRSMLGILTPSQKTLQMADGTTVPSHGQWSKNVILKGHIVKGVFKVFPSRGRWSLLFRKPLLKQFKAIHNYKHDTLMIL